MPTAGTLRPLSPRILPPGPTVDVGAPTGPRTCSRDWLSPTSVNRSFHCWMMHVFLPLPLLTCSSSANSAVSAHACTHQRRSPRVPGVCAGAHTVTAARGVVHPHLELLQGLADGDLALGTALELLQELRVGKKTTSIRSLAVSRQRPTRVSKAAVADMA